MAAACEFFRYLTHHFSRKAGLHRFAKRAVRHEYAGIQQEQNRQSWFLLAEL